MRALPDRRTFLATIGAGLVGTPRIARGAGPPSGPGNINAHAGTWDSKRRATMVFGGADEGRVLGTLWQFHARRWRVLSAAGPPPRTFAGVTYDSRRDRLIVFGGNRVLFGADDNADTLLDDHWEWDGIGWRQFTGPRPPGRTEALLAFDPLRQRSILFGGWRWQNGQRMRLSDLWEFDGARWTQVFVTGPEPRSGMAAAWDSVAQRLVMVGGNGPRHDVWGLNGRGWSKLPDLPHGRFNPALAFDGRHQRMVLFGGWTGQNRIAATLTYDGRQWHSYAGQEPAARNHALLAQTGDGSRLLLVGGHDGDRVFADQWEWNGRWRLLRDAAPKHRIDNGH